MLQVLRAASRLLVLCVGAEVRVPCRLARDGNQSRAAFEGGSAPGGCGGGFGLEALVMTHELLLSGGALCCPCGCHHLAVRLWDARIITVSSDSPKLVPDILILLDLLLLWNAITTLRP